MPIYEYRCTACNRITEEWVRSFDASDDVPCEHCGKPAQRIMSHTSFLLKGGGWYVTEYGSHKNVPAETPAPASSTTETAEAKPAETTTTAADSGSTTSSESAAAPAVAETASKTETKTETKATAA